MYDANGKTLREALEDYEENFDLDNIISSGDSFEEGCLGSGIIAWRYSKRQRN